MLAGDAERPTSRSRTASIAGDRARARRAGARGARRARAARAAGRDRRPRALQRARAAPTGRAGRPAPPRSPPAAPPPASRCRSTPTRRPSTAPPSTPRSPRRAGRAAVDFALWGGLVPGDLDRLDELAARGVVGFKAFMCDSGIEDFQAVDDDALGAGMERAAALGLPVAVHAERPARLRAAARRRAGARGPPRARRRAELAAIERALELAEETGCSLHVVHVSIGDGVAAVAEARGRGVDATCETCPHYLVLTADDMERLGTLAKCAPPLRPTTEREALWEQLERAVDARRLRPLALPARHEGGRLRRRLGRDRRRADDAAAAARRGPAPRGAARPRSPTSSPARPPAASACPARAASRPAPTPTSRWSSSAASTAVGELRDRHRANPFAGRRLARPRRPYAAARRPHDGRIAHGRAARPREERNLNERPEDHRRTVRVPRALGARGRAEARARRSSSCSRSATRSSTCAGAASRRGSRSAT